MSLPPALHLGSGPSRSWSEIGPDQPPPQNALLSYTNCHPQRISWAFPEKRPPPLRKGRTLSAADEPAQDTETVTDPIRISPYDYPCRTVFDGQEAARLLLTEVVTQELAASESQGRAGP